MKKMFIIVITLLLTATAFAQAKAYYAKSASDSRPVIQTEAAAGSNRLPRAKRLHPFVYCRDGAKSYSHQNVCTSHGGTAHRSPMV